MKAKEAHYLTRVNEDQFMETDLAKDLDSRVLKAATSGLFSFYCNDVDWDDDFIQKVHSYCWHKGFDVVFDPDGFVVSWVEPNE